MRSQATTSVCVIVPCRNEEKFIRQCLDSILSFELPAHTELTVLVLDGGSTDATPAIVSEFARAKSNVRYLTNPRRYQACAVNIAVQSERADYYLWLGAHTHFSRNYVRLCLETAVRTGAPVVGGYCITLPGGDGLGALVVQALTTHKFGVGNSGFRTGATEGPVDTVAYALFSRKVFDSIGYLDERLIRAQDYEFNQRIRAAGMNIWFNPEIQCSYHNQPTFAKFLKKQVVLEAPYNAYLWYIAPYAFAPRHAITGVFATGCIGGMLLSPLDSRLAALFGAVMAFYALLAVGSAIQQAVRYRNVAHVFILPFCFFLFHFIHGLGILWGGLRLLTRTAPVQPLTEPWRDAGYIRWRPAVKAVAQC
ncbi:MAG: glycosyltransferase family 2 protein [Verrucomicrobia bacterium]|nr:glycosyltransferase family 2 protein [Verrucomicrobiota bacterium]